MLDCNADLGEGAIWDSSAGVLYWVDIDRREVHIFDPGTGKDRSFDVGQSVGTVVKRRSGGLMLAVRDGFGSLDPKTGKFELVAAPEGHKPEHRFNDGKCDPQGRFWAGTMEAGDEKGALFRLDPGGNVRRMLPGVSVSNGIVWSLDKKTMYYIDTATGKVEAFDYDDKSGNISGRRAVVAVPADLGHPDGMTIDAEGMLWVAHWDGFCVCRWDSASGKLIRRVKLPTARITSCAFGGPNLDQLYITSARTGIDGEALSSQHGAGGLWRINPGVKGMPAFEFAG